jgi:TfoX/Sxy family transcriptional regulator of competence genes
MAYDEGLAQRIEEALAGQPGYEAKKMFGGVGYMLQGNMACGVNQDNLIVRVGPDSYEEAMAQDHTAPFDMTGRPMKGWVVVLPEGYQEDRDLSSWVQKGVDFALSLPAK